jgi:hypothetical protein
MRSEQKHLALVRFMPKPPPSMKQEYYQKLLEYMQFREKLETFASYDSWPDGDFICWCPDSTKASFALDHHTGALPEEFPPRVRVLKQFTMDVVFAIDNVLTDCFLKILVVVIQAHLLAPLPFLPNVAFVQTWCITPCPQTIIPLYSVIIEILTITDQTLHQ